MPNAKQKKVLTKLTPVSPVRFCLTNRHEPLVGNLSSTGRATSTQNALTQHAEEILHAPNASIPFSASLTTGIKRIASERKTEDEFVTKVKTLPTAEKYAMLKRHS